MSAEHATTNGDGRDQDTFGPLYVVRVDDHIDGRIAGHDGYAYVNPPAPRDSALALVRLLLGRDPRAMNGATAWTHAVPGGRRTITLAPASDRTG